MKERSEFVQQKRLKMASAALKLGKQVKELRLHMCNVSAASQGLRDFVENHYITLKKNNSSLPILVSWYFDFSAPSHTGL